MGREKSAEAIVVGVNRPPRDLLAGEGPNLLLQGAVGTISMNVERQQGRLYQRLLFEGPAESLRHGEGSEGSTRPSPREASQAFTATDPARALTQHLMEEVVNRENLNQAYRQVKAKVLAFNNDVTSVRRHIKWDWATI